MIDAVPFDMIFILPVLLAVAAMVLLPAMLAPQARAQGALLVMGVLLVTALLAMGLIKGNTPPHHQVLLAMFAMLGASLASAPLLDRARPLALVIAAPLGSFAMLYALFYNSDLAPAAMPAMVVIAATAMGLAGSIALPLHPTRCRTDGRIRVQTLPHGLALAGWSLLAVVLLGLCYRVNLMLLPVLACAGAAAFTSLLLADQRASLVMAGQALAAGVIMMSLAKVNVETAMILGVLAGFLVTRGPAITAALQVDDPQHLAGGLLLPALTGLLLPGLLHLQTLAPQLVLIGFALIIGGAVAVILWPLTMLIFGVALPRPLVREGLGTY